MSSRKTVLIAEDSAINRKILVKLLSAEYHTLEAVNGQEALTLLRKNSHGISGVILDLVMPVMDGFDVLRAVHQDASLQNIPILVATANAGSDAETTALRLGAWDFITKPYNGEVILFRLRNAIARSQLSAFEQLKYLAEYDTLTGIYNKATFFQSTRRMLDEHPEQRFALIRLDIDRFQLINSFFGMEEGNRLLIYLAQSLRPKKAQTNYTYGRIEADVFAICFSYPSEEAVLQELERSKARVKSYNPSFDIVPIFGVYFLDDLSLPVSELLDRATLAAKTCKGNYVNTTAVYHPELSQRLAQEQEIINEMVSALESKQFCVYLQPKYALETNLPAGAEALVRWQHPTKGMISPGVFIPVFEKNGFIAKLDCYVWEQVCMLLAGWLKKGYQPEPISVNVSRVNLYNPNTVSIISDLVEKYNIPPQLLQLELTESAYMDNPQMMEQVVRQFHDRHFTVLMDDFGSGYSSLSVLKDIEVDVLKIDMRFFENTKVPGRGENIVASVVRMAKWLNMPTVAEGVEKEEQISFLRSVGCDYVQGYYFTHPMSVAAYQRLILKTSLPSSAKQLTAADRFDVDRLWCSDPEIEILFCNATQANCIYEFDGERIEALRVNKAFNELFGYHQQFSQTGLSNFVVPDDFNQVQQAFRNCTDGKSTEECIYRRHDTAGRICWVDLKLQYICPVGTKHILIGHLSDITAQKSMEYQLAKFRNAVADAGETRQSMLIIDDEESSVAQLQLIFQKDYQILTASNGQQGLSLLQANRDSVAVILLDMRMPVMDGTEFLLRKNENPDVVAIPVVVISADDNSTRQQDMLRLGVNDYITKPFLPEVVDRRVKNVLEYSSRFAAIAQEYQKAVARLPDEGLFAINGIYTPAEIHMLQVFLSPVFDVVRLVDPTDTAVITVEEDGSLTRRPYSCFRVWGKETRCENCTSICGMQAHCQLTKYEFIENNVFYVVSNPILVSNHSEEPHRLVLEIVSRVSDHLMRKRYNGKTMKQLIEETQKKIYTDELTGTYNRRYFREMLFAHHGQTGIVTQLALVMLDLRSFKQINDQHGHAIGDDVLVRVAKALTGIVRQNDSVIRYGGDEFLLIFTNCKEPQVKSALNRVRKAVESIHYGDGNIVHADFGYAYTNQFDLKKETLESMLKIADAAMYACKKQAHPTDSSEA